MEFKDYYQVLGVARDAPAEEIKKSYRKLAANTIRTSRRSRMPTRA
jgi:curved DNA-binding protein CbpA